MRLPGVRVLLGQGRQRLASVEAANGIEEAEGDDERVLPQDQIQTVYSTEGVAPVSARGILLTALMHCNRMSI